MTKSRTAAPEATGSGGQSGSCRARPSISEIERIHNRPFRVRWKGKLRMIPLPTYRRMAHLRLSELETLYRARWGAILPDDDAGREDMADALGHIAHMHGDVTEIMMAWIARWAPWLPEDEARSLCERIKADPPRYDADELGERMRLDMLEREKLGIKTFSAFNMPKNLVLSDGTKHPLRAEFRRRYKNAVRKIERKKRRKPTITAAAPWKAAGVSRATWYRRKRRETKNGLSIYL